MSWAEDDPMFGSKAKVSGLTGPHDRHDIVPDHEQQKRKTARS